MLNKWYGWVDPKGPPSPNMCIWFGVTGVDLPFLQKHLNGHQLIVLILTRLSAIIWLDRHREQWGSNVKWGRMKPPEANVVHT